MGEIGFYFFGHFIAYYGLMIVLGLLAGSFFAYLQIKRFGLVLDHFIILCSISGLSGILGAKILYLAVSFPDIDFSRLQDPVYISALMSGGFVFLGGVTAALPTLLFCQKKLHIPVSAYVQPCIGCLPIAHAFGRIGCFLVGCCYGRPYTGPFSVTYTQSAFAPNQTPLFPVQLAEALFEFTIGICLVAFSRRLKGYMGVWVYLAAYSIARFFLEYMRYDQARGMIAGLSTSQIISIFLFVGSLLFLLREMHLPHPQR